MAAFHAGPAGHLHDAALLRQAYYFVDFFFVLSGFVIASNYGARLVDRASLGSFLLLRLGRLYPLHLAMLAAFIGLELLKFVPGLGATAADAPFATPQSAPEAIVTNLLLIHSLGVHDAYAWNTPSWSISTEFYTYVLFGIAAVLFRRHLIWLLLAALALSPIALAMLHGSLAADYDYGLLRCVFGFAAGALAWQVYRELDRRRTWQPTFLAFTTMEVAGAAAVALAVATASGIGSLALPYLFAAAVLVFACEGGLLSRALRHPWLVLLGALSYSIYMTHMLVRRLLLNLADAAARLGGPDLVRPVDDGARVIGLEPWQGDVYLLVYLALVIGLSYVTFRLIELPARLWSRAVVRRRAPAWQAALR